MRALRIANITFGTSTPWTPRWSTKWDDFEKNLAPFTVCKQTTVGGGWPILATISTSADDQLKNLYRSPFMHCCAIHCWVVDEGRLYLAGIKDMATRKIVGWAMEI